MFCWSSPLYKIGTTLWSYSQHRDDSWIPTSNTLTHVKMKAEKNGGGGRLLVRSKDDPVPPEVGMSVISAAQRKCHTWCQINICSNMCIIFHSKVHFIAYCKLFLLYFVFVSPFPMKLCSVRNIIWCTKLNKDAQCNFLIQLVAINCSWWIKIWHQFPSDLLYCIQELP
jgi:hypothetical protein